VREPENLEKYVPDLQKDPLVRFISKTFFVWTLLGLIIPAAIGGLVTGTWMGVLLGFLWGGLARIFLVHHVTWSVNSVCHLWGSRPFRSHDHSRNNALFGILAFGEGWHNNHHAFPASAKHGLRPWQFDLSYTVIRALELVGLARDVRVPTPERQEAKLARTPSKPAK
jgi:stearoyl-CoA desaturase (delta-9 desaturase)